MSSVAVGCSLLLLALAGATSAEQLNFSTVPAGSGGREPAPNVILSLDNSGSMGWDVATDNATDVVANKKITLLKQALAAQFGDGTATPPTKGKVPDGRIRLAWQSMHVAGNPTGADTLALGATNSMKLFSGTHRANFTTFINNMTLGGGTPSHKMMESAYNYMRSPAGTNSPWADTPGTAQTTPYLACRRTYHIFLTDGAWNSVWERVGTGKTKTYELSDAWLAAGNIDGTNRTLGDGSTRYNVASNQANAYKDSYGGIAGEPSTLSDLAFRGWATDLQDGTGGTQNMANSVEPLIRKKGPEIFSSGTNCAAASTCRATQEFWNPRNDPANWQHMVQHTIGFGPGAVNWPYGPSSVLADDAKTAAGRLGPKAWVKDSPDLTDNPTDDTFGGDLPKLIQGELVWSDVQTYSTGTPDIRTLDLWHSAINGRGKFYPARSVDALTTAFEEIINSVIEDSTPKLVSIASSSNFLRTGLNAYQAGYSSAKYSGTVSARPLDATTGAMGTTETWSASNILDGIPNANVNDRFVMSFNGTSGISWKGSSASDITNLPALQQTALNKNSAGAVDNKGADRVAYLRGDRTKEIGSGGLFRDRDSRLGDVVNSNIWYTGKPASGYTADNYDTFRSATAVGGKGGRTPMVYIGANDGMLHGFAAANWPSDTTRTKVGGAELIAYIPQGIAEGSLRKLTDENYAHKYYVDGSPFTGDAFIGATPAWKTVLVGTLGAGGKGYFILDVTDPSQFTLANVANLVIKDTTATTDADIGYVFSQPVVDEAVANKSRQIVKMNGGRWAAVLGNGYNSTNEAPVLLIQYLDGDKSVKKISPCTLPTTSACTFQGTNGLSSPQLIDLDGNGTVDVAYAGDLKGNVWKFNLTGATDSSWSVGFSGQPFFVAKPSATVTQSITTAPYWMQHPLGGIMLAVGTGRNVTDADQSAAATDTVYGLYDNSTFTAASGVVTMTDTTPINTIASTSVPSTLVQQSLAGAPALIAGASYSATTSNPVNYFPTPASIGPPAVAAIPAKRGWYFNLPLSGERVMSNFRSASGEKIFINSTIPRAGSSGTAETCSTSITAESSIKTVVNMITGAAPKVAPYPDPSITIDPSNPFNPNRRESTGTESMVLRKPDGGGVDTPPCAAGKECTPQTVIFGSSVGARVNWRLVQ